MNLRDATLADTAALAEFARHSFATTFGHLYRPQDLAAFSAEAYAPEVVAQEIAGTECIHQLAEIDGQLSGYCKLRWPSKFPGHSTATNAIDLSQIYTDPERTGQGIGAALMDWTIATARDRGHDAVLLSVWSGNHGAQRFYDRYAFSKIADIDFRVGDQLDEEYLFEKRF